MATHALIPLPWREALARVAESTGTCQSQLVAGSAVRLLAKAAQGFIPDSPPMPRGSLVALVARIPGETQAALHALAARTRIRYSEWLRQSVVDVLREHGALAESPASEIAPLPPPADGRCRCGFRLLPGERDACQDCREVAA